MNFLNGSHSQLRTYGTKRDFQDRLYNAYWRPMEELFGDQYTDRFDDFIRDYLTLKTRDIPKINEVYDRFKVYIQERKKSETLETIEPIITENFSFFHSTMWLLSWIWRKIQNSTTIFRISIHLMLRSLSRFCLKSMMTISKNISKNRI